MTFAIDWLNILFRWAHMVAGIGWIGASFYFIALDLSLRARKGQASELHGSAWLVHGGGFYNVEKYVSAPSDLPPDLVWYKWEAYLTWVTGFALLVLQYYINASSYLIDTSKFPLTPGEASVLSMASLLLGWIIYDLICKSPIGKNTTVLAIVTFGMIVGFSYMFGQIFSGRGAFIHVGALVGTIMAVNVFCVIIPNQKKIVASLLRGEKPDIRLGQVSKQRSIHNNYLTLPVLLMMVSNHYPMLTQHHQGWLLVAFILVLGAMGRHFLNRHEAGDSFGKIAWTLPVAAVALAACIYLTRPMGPEEFADVIVDDVEVTQIISKHCSMCHAKNPSHENFDAPPKEVTLEDLGALRKHAALIMKQSVQTDAMPLGNETGMSADERLMLGAWLSRQ